MEVKIDSARAMNAVASWYSIMSTISPFSTASWYSCSAVSRTAIATCALNAGSSLSVWLITDVSAPSSNMLMFATSVWTCDVDMELIWLASAVNSPSSSSLSSSLCSASSPSISAYTSWTGWPACAMASSALPACLLATACVRWPLMYSRLAAKSTCSSLSWENTGIAAEIEVIRIVAMTIDARLCILIVRCA